MRKCIYISLLALLLAAGCPSTRDDVLRDVYRISADAEQAWQGPKKIPVKGPYLHTYSGMVFPRKVGNAVLTENFNYATWRAPLTILQPRFAKFSVQLDF